MLPGAWIQNNAGWEKEVRNMPSAPPRGSTDERPLVVLADPIRLEEVPWWQMVVGERQARLVTPDRREDPAELARVSRDAVAVVCREGVIDRALMEHARRLRLIQKVGWAGNNVDMDAARRLGIRVEICLNPLRIPVAEHTLLLMLALAKQLIPAHRAVDRGENPRGIAPFRTAERLYAYNWLGQTSLQPLFRRTLGLVGLGEIGTNVAKRARAFEMELVYFDLRRLPTDQEQALDLHYAEFPQVLRESDYVSLHVPYSQATHHLIGEAEFRLMKPSAFLINTCRGGVVDQKALAKALTAGKIAGAGLDVFEEEPLVGRHEFAGLPNVVLTPHIAAIREETMDNVLPEIGRHVAWAIEQDRRGAAR
jgi:phosphoglycerate dehydrogenase-like enzyme